MSEGSKGGPLARASAWALGPVPAIRLESFRWTLTLALFVYTLAWSLEAGEWLTAAGFHLSPEASRGLQLPVPLLPPAALPVFLILYIGSMVAILLDLRPRAFSYVVFAGLLYVTTADRLASFSMNKLALVSWLILLLAPWPSSSKSSEAVDSAQLRSAWPLRILQATLLLQYFGAGVCKLRGDWLSSSRVLWLQAQDVYMTDLSAWMVRELPGWVWAGLQHGALAFELLAPILFCVRRLRPLGFAWGLAMHLGIGLMMYRVGYFSLSVVAYYVLFVDERRLLELRQRLRGL
ncbi:MAG: HTTM domain-containing protein [Enhygromyxa sp.]